MKRAVVGVVALAALGIVAVPAVPLGAQSRIIQQVLVKVNGDIFTKTDLEQEQIKVLQDRNRRVNKPEDLQNDATLIPILLEITPDILVNAVDDLLLIQHARELGYKFTDETFKRMVDNIKKDNKLDDAGFKKALEQEHQTMDGFHAFLEHGWLLQAVTQDLLQRLTLTEQEAHDYYDKHPNEFMKPASVVLRELLIAVTTTGTGQQASFTAASDEAASTKVKAIRERVTKGENFTAIVTELSESPTKANGGLLAPVSLADMSDNLRAIIEKMKPGEVTEPLRTARGYQLFQLESMNVAQVETFDKVRDQIAQHVADSRREAEMKKFLVTFRAQALIEWKHDDMKKLYEKRLAEMNGKSGRP